MSLRKSALTGVSAIALSMGLAYSAQATELPVQNLTFNLLTHPLSTGGSAAQTKNFFSTVLPTNWGVSSVGQLIYVGEQGSEGTVTQPRAIFTRFILTRASRLPFRPAPTSIRRTAIRRSRARSFRPFRT